jgi:hypothetical protein
MFGYAIQEHAYLQMCWCHRSVSLGDGYLVSAQFVQPQEPLSWQLEVDYTLLLKWVRGSISSQPLWEAASISGTDQGGNHARMSAQRSPQD